MAPVPKVPHGIGLMYFHSHIPLDLQEGGYLATHFIYGNILKLYYSAPIKQTAKCNPWNLEKYSDSRKFKDKQQN